MLRVNLVWPFALSSRRAAAEIASNQTELAAIQPTRGGDFGVAHWTLLRNRNANPAVHTCILYFASAHFPCTNSPEKTNDFVPKATRINNHMK